MSGRESSSLRSIRHTLLLGFGVLVVLLIVAGVLGAYTMTRLSATITTTLAAVQEEARLGLGKSD